MNNLTLKEALEIYDHKKHFLRWHNGDNIELVDSVFKFESGAVVPFNEDYPFKNGWSLVDKDDSYTSDEDLLAAFFNETPQKTIPQLITLVREAESEKYSGFFNAMDELMKSELPGIAYNRFDKVKEEFTKLKKHLDKHK